MKKSIILITLLLFLAIPLVTAEQEVKLSATPATYNVEAGQSLDIELTLRNVGDKKDTILVESVSIKQEAHITILPGEKRIRTQIL